MPSGLCSALLAHDLAIDVLRLLLELFDYVKYVFAPVKKKSMVKVPSEQFGELSVRKILSDHKKTLLRVRRCACSMARSRGTWLLRGLGIR